MAINPSLLVQADILQDYFVDKTLGTPLAAGIVTFYQDTSRTTLKNVYYLTGAPNNYSYLPLPNPVILSSVGTFQDANGNDIIPYYYPYDETNSTPIVQPYYVTVYSANSDGTPAVLQFTRQNFPLVPQIPSPGSQVATNKNYIVNKEFWRNIGSVTSTSLSNTISFNGNTYYKIVLAPSQHEGFSVPDITFLKNTNDATDVITFATFPAPASPGGSQTFADNVLQGDVTPEFYMNVNCTGTGTETQKFVQIPLSFHIKSLSGAPFTITFQAMNANGGPNNTLTVSILQFLGTGLVNSISTYMTETLSDGWAKYTINGFFPSAQNVVTSGTFDDALYLQLGFPVGETFDFNIAMPSLYIGNQAATNDFDTYDQINSITSAPRTGDIRISANSFAPYGWVAVNDGTIGNSSAIITGQPTSRAANDTFPLFSLIWNATNNGTCQLFNTSGAPISRGATAQADYIANNGLALPKTLGRVLSSVGVPSSGGTGTNWGLGQLVGNETPPPATVQGGTGASVAASAGTDNMQPTTHYNMFFKL